MTVTTVPAPGSDQVAAQAAMAEQGTFARCRRCRLLDHPGSCGNAKAAAVETARKWLTWTQNQRLTDSEALKHEHDRSRRVMRRVLKDNRSAQVTIDAITQFMAAKAAYYADLGV